MSRLGNGKQIVTPPTVETTFWKPTKSIVSTCQIGTPKFCRIVSTSVGRPFTYAAFSRLKVLVPAMRTQRSRGKESTHASCVSRSMRSTMIVSVREPPTLPKDFS